MQAAEEHEEPIPLSTRTSRPPPPPKWSSAPPPAMPRKRSRLALAAIGVAWAAIGIASAAYVIQHRDTRANVAATDATP